MSAVATTTHSEFVCFNVEGKFLANLTRDLVEEGNWERGLKLLMENLHGMTYELAVSLLKGEADLTGWSSEPEGIRLKPLKPTGALAKKMQKRLDYLYRSTFRYGESYWKPYGRVTSWGGADMAFAQQASGLHIVDGTMRSNSTRYNPVLERRSLYYAKNPTQDLLMCVPLTVGARSAEILCEKASMPPLWYVVSRESPIVLLQRLLEEGLDLEELGVSEDEPPSERELSVAPRETATPPDLPRNEDEEISSRDFTRLRERIREQANEHGGFLSLALLNEQDEPYAEQPFLEVPRHAFLLWALRGFDFESYGKVRPTWQPVSPMGLKLPMDDQMHSDWMLGAGLELDSAYDNERHSLERVIQSSAAHERAKLVKEWTGAEFVVLARGESRYFCGQVILAQPNTPVPSGCIAIAPSAGPEYQLAMQCANAKDENGTRGVLICATGGKLAHLATVGREQGCTVLMVPNAVEKFKHMHLLSIDMTSGWIYQTC